MFQGQPLHPLKHAQQLFTGASKEGWGVHLNDHSARGTWSLPESRLHINYLELKLLFFLSGSRQVVAYINKEGGDEVGPTVCPSVENPDLVYQDNSNRVVPRPDNSNRVVLLPEVFQPQIDLFATRFNKLAQFVSPVHTPRPGQSMHSACHGRIWIRMPSHQQPSWA